MAKKRKNNEYKKKVVKHLKGDIKTFKKEADEDRELIKKLKKDGSRKKDPKKPAKKHEEKEKVETVMHEWKEGELHSGSKKGPKVKNKKQAIAIALSEARKMGKKKRRSSK